MKEKIMKLEPPSGLEPETPALPWQCSTTELRRRNNDVCTMLDGLPATTSRVKKKLEPPTGLEPVTYRLRSDRSTS